MRDIRFITITDAITIVSISETESSGNRVLRLGTTGGVNYANRVYINDLGIDNFTATSATVVFVTLPSTLDSLSVEDMEISISSSRLTSTNAPAEITFGTTKQIGYLEGIQKLIQQVLKSILTNTGSNRFAPDEGGGLLKGLSSTPLNEEGRAKVSSIVQSSVVYTLERITQNQSGTRVPADERLLSLELLAVDFDQLLGAVTAQVKLTTYAGTSYSIPLAL